MIHSIRSILSLSLLFAVPSIGADYTFEWTAATGPVASYDVLVQRNGGAYVRDQSVLTTEAEVSCSDGESLSVRVAGVASDGRVSPLSRASLPLHCLLETLPMDAPGQPGVRITIQVGP